MGIEIHHAPAEMMWDLKKGSASLAGRCFENCVIAVIALPALELQYVLGFVTPPGYSSVAHAWLQQESANGPIYFDPTLQDSSPLWAQQSSKFIYDKRYCLTRDDLLAWFRSRYPDRKFSEVGIPEGLARGPIINTAGNVE